MSEPVGRIKIGDVVRLRSDGQMMTVTEWRGPMTPHVKVVWLAADGTPQQIYAPQECFLVESQKQ